MTSNEWEGLGPVNATSVNVTDPITGSTVQILPSPANGPEILFTNPSLDTIVSVFYFVLDQVLIYLEDTGGFAIGGGLELSIQHLFLVMRDVAGVQQNKLQLFPTQTTIQQSIIIENEIWRTPALINGWVQIPGYLAIQYRFGIENNVKFKGTIHNGVNADNTQITTLPAGYRPQANVLLRPPVGPSGAGNVGSSRIFITAAGGVFIYGMTGVTDIGFDGLEFSLDP